MDENSDLKPVFVGRGAEQRHFRRVLQDVQSTSDEREDGHVFLIHGHGGIGKSQLLKRLHDIASGEFDAGVGPREFTVALVNWEDHRESKPEEYRDFAGPDIAMVLLALETRLRATADGKAVKRAFRDFHDRMKEIPQAQRRAESAGLNQDLTGSRPDAGQLARSGVEFAADTAGVLGVPAASAVKSAAANTAEVAARALGSIRRRRVSHAEVDRIFAPVDALVAAFTRGLRQLSQGRPVVLFLDTTELVMGAAPGLRKVMRGCGSRVLWVLAGRMEAEADADEDSESSAFRRDIAHDRLVENPLGSFDKASVEEFLRQTLGAEAVGAELVDRVVRVSRRIPLALEFIVKMLLKGEPLDQLLPVDAAADASQVVERLAKRYLVHVRHTPELAPDVEPLYALALSGGGAEDSRLLATMLDRPESEIAQLVFGLARRHDFMLSGRGHLHEEFRRTVLAYLRQPQRLGDVRDLNRRAAGLLLERAESTAGDLETRLSDEDWQQTVAEALRHTMWADVDDGLALLRGLLSSALVLAPWFAGRLIATATEFAPLLTPEQRRRLTEMDGADWGRPGALRAVAAWCADSGAEGEGPLAGDVPRAVYLTVLNDANESADGREQLAALEQAAAVLPEPAVRTRAALAERSTRLCVELVVPLTLREGPSSLAVRAARLAHELSPQDTGNLRFLGLAHLAEGDEATACEYLDRFVAAAEESARGRLLQSLGHDVKAVGHPKLAAEYFERALDREPENADVWNFRGVSLAEAGLQREAMDCYVEATHRDEFHTWAQWNFAEAQRVLGDEEWYDSMSEAERRLRHRFDDDPRDVELRTVLGHVLEALAKPEEALAVLDGLPEPDWDNQVRRLAARQLYAIDRPAEAVEQLRRCDMDGADAVELRVELSDALEAAGEYAEARRQIHTALEQLRARAAAAGSTPFDWAWLGLAAARLELCAESAEAYRHAAEAQPDNIDAQFKYAVALRDIGDFDAAITILREVLKANPVHTLAREQLGYAYYWSGASGRYVRELDDAVARLRTLLDTRPGQIWYRLDLADVLYQLNRHEEVLEALAPLLERHPGHPGANYDQALALCGLGRYGEAEAAFRTAIAATGVNADSIERLSSLLCALGRTSEAITLNRNALRGRSDDNKLRTALARAQRLSGELGSARSTLRRIAENWPGDTLAARSHAELALLHDPPEQAREILEETLARFPGDHAGPGFWLGLLLRGRDPQRSHELLSAAEADPVGNLVLESACQQRAVILTALGRPDAAIDALAPLEGTPRADSLVAPLWRFLDDPPTPGLDRVSAELARLGRPRHDADG